MPDTLSHADAAAPVAIDCSLPLSVVLMEVERRYLAAALTEAQGNQAQAARLSGLTAETFRKKLARYRVRASFCLS